MSLVANSRHVKKKFGSTIFNSSFKVYEWKKLKTNTDGTFKYEFRKKVQGKKYMKKSPVIQSALIGSKVDRKIMCIRS